MGERGTSGEHRPLHSSLPGPTHTPDAMIEIVRAALSQEAEDLLTLIEGLPAPIYLTDADGWVTLCNTACVDLAGRAPIRGEDRWCPWLRLYTESGVYVPPGQSPLALAIRDKKPVRGVIAVIERPDGSRVMFLPYPTPVLDAAGVVTGAINLLIDITDGRQPDALNAQAARCRRLAESVSDPRTIETLRHMAEDYEEKASSL